MQSGPVFLVHPVNLLYTLKGCFLLGCAPWRLAKDKPGWLYNNDNTRWTACSVDSDEVCGSCQQRQHRGRACQCESHHCLSLMLSSYRTVPKCTGYVHVSYMKHVSDLCPVSTIPLPFFCLPSRRSAVVVKFRCSVKIT